MNSNTRILTAFVLNLIFSLMEFMGGMLSGSTAILSDAVHDLGDALSIGISYALDRFSRKPPNDTYTFGYKAFSTLGSILTTSSLLAGSVLIIVHAVRRLFIPTPVHSNSMLLFAVIGLTVNGIAALITHHGDSHNQKAVFLHMLEDVLGWAVVLAGAVIIHFTGWTWIDPLLSIGVAGFLIFHALHYLTESSTVLLGKVPRGTDIRKIRESIAAVDGVYDIHELRVWSFDGQERYATVRIASSIDCNTVTSHVRNLLTTYGIDNVTIETTVLCHPRSPSHML